RGHREEEIHRVLGKGVDAGLAQALDEVRVPVDGLALHREAPPAADDAQCRERRHGQQHEKQDLVVQCYSSSTLPVSPGVSLTDITVARGKKLNSLADAQV